MSFEKRLEAGEFAHDVKHYLMVVEELLCVARSGPEESRLLALQKIEKAVRRLMRETNTVLLADKDDSGLLTLSPLPISISEMVEDAVKDFEPLFAASNIALKCELSPSVRTSEIDPALFPHVLQNLLDNALKYSADGGEIVIRTGEVGETAILEVENSGNLFSSKELDRLFERHFRAKNATHVPGNGLGLHLVRRIVDRHGGEASAELSDHGTVTFRVALPVVDGNEK